MRDAADGRRRRARRPQRASWRSPSRSAWSPASRRSPTRRRPRSSRRSSRSRPATRSCSPSTPSAQECSVAAARVVRDAAVAAGAPEDCIQWIEQPVARGDVRAHAPPRRRAHPRDRRQRDGPGGVLVRQARARRRCRQRPGLRRRATARAAARGERRRAVQGVRQRHGLRVRAGRHPRRPRSTTPRWPSSRVLHAHRCYAGGEGACSRSSSSALPRGAASCAGARLNAGRRRAEPAVDRRAGRASRVPDDTSILLAEVSGVGPHEPLTREKLCPVLAVLRAESTEHGIALAEPMVEFDGLGHSAAIHTEDAALAERVRQPGQGGPGHLELAVVAGRHRRHLQRLHPVADARLRLLRAQLGVEQRLGGQPAQHQADRAAHQQPAVVQGAGARPTSSRTRSATSPTCPTCTGSPSSPTRR